MALVLTTRTRTTSTTSKPSECDDEQLRGWQQQQQQQQLTPFVVVEYDPCVVVVEGLDDYYEYAVRGPQARIHGQYRKQSSALSPHPEERRLRQCELEMSCCGEAGKHTRPLEPGELERRYYVDDDDDDHDEPTTIVTLTPAFPPPS